MKIKFNQALVIPPFLDRSKNSEDKKKTKSLRS
jgi:hypothetical protein